jgi:hypothetical protein
MTLKFKINWKKLINIWAFKGQMTTNEEVKWFYVGSWKVIEFSILSIKLTPTYLII